jgi:hypothetical protein
MAPSKDYVVLGSQALVICRPTAIRSHAYHPLAQPPNVAQMLHSYSNTVLHWARQPGTALHGTAQLVPAAAGATAGEHASLSHEWLPAMEDWSEAGLSQVEALRRQVEAGSSSSSSQTPQLQNNIVNVSRLVAASSLVTASHAMGKRGAAVAAAPAGVGAAAALSNAGSSSAATMPQVRRLDNVSGPVCQWPSSMSSDAASNSSAGRSTPPGLRTTDWPVLSGVRAPHKLSAALWPHFSMPGISSRLQSRAAGNGLGLGSSSNSSSSSSSRVGLPVMPVAPAADALAEAFAAAQATVMVPSEYLQVCLLSVDEAAYHAVAMLGLRWLQHAPAASPCQHVSLLSIYSCLCMRRIPKTQQRSPCVPHAWCCLTG